MGACGAGRIRTCGPLKTTTCGLANRRLKPGSATAPFCAAPGSRTQTVRFLRPVHLPVVLERRAGSRGRTCTGTGLSRLPLPMLGYASFERPAGIEPASAALQAAPSPSGSRRVSAFSLLWARADSNRRRHEGRLVYSQVELPLSDSPRRAHALGMCCLRD